MIYILFLENLSIDSEVILKKHKHDDAVSLPLCMKDYNSFLYSRNIDVWWYVKLFLLLILWLASLSSLPKSWYF